MQGGRSRDILQYWSKANPAQFMWQVSYFFYGVAFWRPRGICCVQGLLTHFNKGTQWLMHDNEATPMTLRDATFLEKEKGDKTGADWCLFSLIHVPAHPGYSYNLSSVCNRSDSPAWQDTSSECLCNFGNGLQSSASTLATCGNCKNGSEAIDLIKQLKLFCNVDHIQATTSFYVNKDT